jgi:hypothetical protein
MNANKKPIEILHRFTMAVLFSAAVDTVKEAVELAVKQGANLDGANLTRANLDGANLYGANLTRANLDGANLTRANLDGANLDGANLDGANLYGANLARANLTRANLDGANLARANLDGANLYGANLDGANLTRANLDGAKLPAPTVVLLAGWGEVSAQLCADLMLWDSINHPEPARFDVWAKGGECPYGKGINVQRAANFSESRTLWGQGQPCRPYDLMVRVVAEKCPAWTDEQSAKFAKKFEKARQ